MTGIVEKLIKFGTLNRHATGSFDDRDQRLIRTRSYASRLERAFSRTPYPFEIYTANMEVDRKQFTFSYTSKVGQWSKQRVKDLIDPDFHHNPDAITLILTNNYADSAHPLTPWIVAHRFSHAVEAGDGRQHQTRESRFFRVLNNLETEVARVYDSTGFALHDRQEAWIEIVGMMTTKSAKEVRKDPQQRMHYGEAQIELLTQFIVKGSITFDTSGMDDNEDYSPELRDGLKQVAGKYTRILNREAANTLSRCVGSIFVI